MRSSAKSRPSSRRRSAPSEPRHRSPGSGEHERLRSSKTSRIPAQIDLRAEVLTSSKASSTPKGNKPSFRTSTEPEPELPDQNRWWRRRRLRSKPKLSEQRGGSLFGWGSPLVLGLVPQLSVKTGDRPRAHLRTSSKERPWCHSPCETSDPAKLPQTPSLFLPREALRAPSCPVH